MNDGRDWLTDVWTKEGDMADENFLAAFRTCLVCGELVMCGADEVAPVCAKHPADAQVHTPDCYQLEKRPCQAGISLHGEPPEEHSWSGWPGAWCQKCHSEDKDELCIGGCECPCHDQFWEDYFKAEEEAARHDFPVERDEVPPADSTAEESI